MSICACLSNSQGSICGRSVLVSETCCPSGANIIASYPAYDNDAAAGVGGLISGNIWKTSSTNTLGLPAGVVMVKQ